MQTLIIIVHVLAALGVTGLVLIQHGKGADMGASFGSGASQTIFGSVGSGNALTKSTTWLATVFFITSLVLAIFAKDQASQGIEDNFLIDDAGQLDTQVQQAPDSIVPAASDLPALPATDSQIVDEIPAAPQNSAESAEVTPEPAAVDSSITDEEPAEDLQNATQN
ncbi:MAG: preprotein translocase subunit SecG [Pseudomonadota bacterium]